mgnify:CR=1 FL=1
MRILDTGLQQLYLVPGQVMYLAEGIEQGSRCLKRSCQTDAMLFPVIHRCPEQNQTDSGQEHSSPAAQGNAAVAIDAGVGPSRTALALLGLGLILALFGAYQLFGKRRP